MGPRAWGAPAVGRAPAAIEAQASAQARDRLCPTYLDEYQRLSWDYQSQADRKKLLLDMIASTGSGIALTPLNQEYERLSWDYQSQAERKRLLMGVVSKLLSGTGVPCSTSTITPAQRDEACKTYLGEYQRLSWDYQSQADRKTLLIDMVVATGSDLGITAFSEEYQRLSWDYQSQADRKRLLLAAMGKALNVPTVPCSDRRQALKKATRAQAALKAALQAELKGAPADAQDAIQAVITAIKGQG
jgi:hypothetical protein